MKRKFPQINTSKYQEIKTRYENGEDCSLIAADLNMHPLSFRQNLALYGIKRKPIEELPMETEDEYNPDTYLANRSLEADEALMNAVKKGNAGALKIYYQLMGKLVDKPLEVNFGFTADDIARERKAAIEELENEEFEGVPKVPGKPTLLPEHVCLHSEQEHSEDS